MTLSPLPSYLRGVDFPILFENALNQNGWELDKLTFSNLAEVLSGRDYEFRLGAKESGDIVWEGGLHYAYYAGVYIVANSHPRRGWELNPR